VNLFTISNAVLVTVWN